MSGMTVVKNENSVTIIESDANVTAIKSVASLIWKMTRESILIKPLRFLPIFS